MSCSSRRVGMPAPGTLSPEHEGLADGEEAEGEAEEEERRRWEEGGG